MKQYILAITISLLFFSGLNAQQYKVLQKSEKKAPAWYETVGTGYLVASTEESDIETARQKCLESIRMQIIQAVAQNVEFSESTTLRQTTQNDEITEFINIYSSEGSTRAAVIPFLKGISLSKVEASYWEKREDKKTKAITYAYAIKYPFTKTDLHLLNKQFDEIDQSMESKLAEFEAKLNNVGSIEEIDQILIQLSPVVDYFFDRTRKQRAQSLQQSYRNLPSYISIEGEETGEKTYRLWFILQGRKITASVLPTMKANCASQLRAVPDGQDIVITYDNIDCLEDEDNYIEATFRISGKSLKHKFYIKGSPQY